MRRNWEYNQLFQKLNDFNTGLVAGNFPASGSYIDTTNLGTLYWLIQAGTLDTETACQVWQDTSATETASIKVVTGALATITVAKANEFFVIEVEQARLDIGNDFRFVTLIISGAAGGNDYASMMFVGDLVRHAPVTQPTASTFVRVAG